jgi:hypothetical protein
MSDVTRDEVKARAAVAGLTVGEEWLEMTRSLLADALAPLRRADVRTLQAIEPAATFDAGSEGGRGDVGR